jgi:alpha-tubulin suppressor-like RCC1 family protein
MPKLNHAIYLSAACLVVACGSSDRGGGFAPDSQSDGGGANDGATADTAPVDAQASDGGGDSDPDGTGGRASPADIPLQRAMSVSRYHSCAIVAPAMLPKCWGKNVNGTLGIGTTTDHGGAAGDMGDQLPHVNLGSLRTAKAIASGHAHTCAILDNGALKCWGDNDYGQLGIGSTEDIGDSANEVGAFVAVDLGPGRTAVDIAAGRDFTCARVDDGTVKCWGYGSWGQLGLGDTAHVGAPLKAVDLGGPASRIACGERHACAVLTSGSVKCWGANQSGQLGLGDTSMRGGSPSTIGSALMPVNLGQAAVAVTAGAGHTCALLADGSLRCWGANNLGQLGIEDRAARGGAPNEMGASLPPVKLGTGRKATVVAAGAYNTCVALDDGTVKCWGQGAGGILGRGNETEIGGELGSMANLTPIDLGTGSRRVVSIAVGPDQACARFDDDAVKCWGANEYGQLGLGDKLDRGILPGQMGASLPFVHLTGP